MSTITFVNYTCTNTSPQTIDTFDLPLEKTISYKIHITSGNTTYYSSLDISHDGVQTSEKQYALAKTGITPLEITTYIANNTGYVNVTPTAINTVFSMERNAVECNLYSENTLSGRNILTDDGLGIYFNNANNITVRKSSGMEYVHANVYVTSGVMGPIKTNESLLGNWQSSNGSIRVIEGDYQVAVSSGQKNNCLFQEIPVLPNRRYILTGNVYYTTDQNLSIQLPDRDTGSCKIRVGTEFNAIDYASYEANTTEEAVSIVFSSTSNTAYVMFGYGDINNRLYVKDFELKEYVPFHTYNQDEGAIYLKWAAVAAGNTILSLNSANANNRVYVDASNNVFINTVNCGAQAAITKVAFSYNANGIVVSKNGNTVITSTDTFNTYIANAVFTSIPYEFAYMANTISNTAMVTLSNV
jgi:hypothetical protein